MWATSLAAASASSSLPSGDIPVRTQPGSKLKTADPLAPDLLSQALGHRGQCSLRSSVGAEVASPAGDRSRHCRDHARATLGHGRSDPSGEGDRSDGIDLEGRVEVVEREGSGRARHLDSGHAGQHVDPAVALDHLVAERGEGRAPGPRGRTGGQLPGRRVGQPVRAAPARAWRRGQRSCRLRPIGSRAPDRCLRRHRSSGISGR